MIPLIAPDQVRHLSPADQRSAGGQGHRGRPAHVDDVDHQPCHRTGNTLQIVLPIGGRAEVRQDCRVTVTAAGLIVLPQFAHACAATSSYAALFVDPWLLRRAPGPTPLDVAAVRRLLAALGDSGAGGPGRATPDLGAAYAELTALTGAVTPLDPRVAHAMNRSAYPGPGGSVESIAAEVGLSPSRLRALVHTSVGPLVRMRQWGRLRTAIACLVRESVAEAAADAGFADQAHFARTARALLGRSPYSLQAGGRPQPGLPFPSTPASLLLLRAGRGRTPQAERGAPSHQPGRHCCVGDSEQE
jgi:AraC-like DNA-binding protein